jgi:AraC family transcriptional activator of pobA
MARREPGIAALFARPLLLELQSPELRATDLALSVRMLAREFRMADTGHRLALNGWLQVLLGNVQRFAHRQASSADPAVGQERLLLEQFFALIERRVRNGHKVDQYATALRVSPSRLRRACQALTGRSPMQLVHARILLEAKRQLHYTDRAVHTIATELGFEDAAYFTRFFSRRAGVSPRVFRQRGPESMLPREPVAR